MSKNINRVILCCPKCGAAMARGGNLEEIELRCPKCKRYFIINHIDKVLTVREQSGEYAVN